MVPHPKQSMNRAESPFSSPTQNVNALRTHREEKWQKENYDLQTCDVGIGESNISHPSVWIVIC